MARTRHGPLSRATLRKLGYKTQAQQAPILKWEAQKAMTPAGREALALLTETRERISLLVGVKCDTGQEPPELESLTAAYRAAAGCMLDRDHERAVLLLTGQVRPCQCAPQPKKAGKLLRFPGRNS